ncbi:MAG: hypothetical protein K2N73_01610 [Lachnospiraceae bacterium]|nr:hypothetical protein [Lachnospiraceae bacterium]
MPKEDWHTITQNYVLIGCDREGICYEGYLLDGNPDPPLYLRACLKNHSCHLYNDAYASYSPLCVIFAPNSGYIARYAPFIWHKSPTNCDAHLSESIFQTRSSCDDDFIEYKKWSDSTEPFLIEMMGETAFDEYAYNVDYYDPKNSISVKEIFAHI